MLSINVISSTWHNLANCIDHGVTFMLHWQMQMPNGVAIQRNRNHINYTQPLLTIPRKGSNFWFYMLTHNPPKQTHKTQRSVLAHFISCCPIPMGRVVNAEDEEVKWTEGKKKLHGGWQPYIQQVASNPWPVITSLSFLSCPLHTVKWDMLLHFFDKFCGTLARTTTG